MFDLIDFVFCGFITIQQSFTGHGMGPRLGCRLFLGFFLAAQDINPSDANAYSNNCRLFNGIGLIWQQI